MVPGRLQSLVELSYEFIGDMVGSTVGKEGRRYFPFIFTLFMFILFGNMLGMIPGSFTYTSHIIVTFSMAIFVVDRGDDHRHRPARLALLQLLRAERLPDLRHAAAGADRDPVLPDPADQPVGAAVRQHDGRPHHAEDLRRLHHRRSAASTWCRRSRRSRSRSALSGLELAIAFLQAYVFTVLTCIYLQDAIHLH